MSLVPHDTWLERVATAAVLFKHRRVNVQPSVYIHTQTTVINKADYVNPLTPTVAIWVQLVLSILYQTGLSRH